MATEVANPSDRKRNDAERERPKQSVNLEKKDRKYDFMPGKDFFNCC